MAENPPRHVKIFPNARDIRIGEQRINIVSGNQYVSSTNQATLIQLLQPILDASHTRDRETSPPNSTCFPGTRTNVIRAIVSWADSTLLWNTHVLWLYGFVGCGKSAIALAIALKFERRNRLVGSFFFFRNTGDRSRMVRFATTLAFQLAAAIPEAAPFIKKAVTEEGLLGSSLVAQLRRLVYEPFKAAAKRVRLLKTSLLKGPFLIVIDGLDECEDRQEVQAFIDDMLEFFKKNPLVPLRFFITSRVKQHIQRRLEKGQVRLENLVNHCSRGDIDKFMHTCFEAEKLENPVVKAYIRNHGDWPAKKDKDQLVDHIGGSFIFASALFKYIVDPTDEQSTPMDRLPHTLNMNPGLDTLYAKTLSRSHHLPHFSDVISTLALTFEPLPIIGIAELLGIECFEVVRVLVNLQAIIHIPGTDDLPVTMCHTSLRDFLTTESRSGCFFTPPSYHLYLLHRCWALHDDGQRSDTAAALYSISHGVKHIDQFTRLPPAAQGPIPRFPETLDALYTHILAKTENHLHFSDIISTIVLCLRLITVDEISHLLGIEAFKVVRVLVNLRPVFDVPEEGGLPILLYHPSVHQFLTTESRSGRFFVSPSYHLRLSYNYFSLTLGLGPDLLSPMVIESHRCQLLYRLHCTHFLAAVSEPTIYDELGQFAHLPSQNSSYWHIFSFTQLFLWAFEGAGPKPQQILPTFTRCIESLALALEFDHAPDKWLQYSVNGHSLFSGIVGRIVPLKMHEEQATALQRSVQRVEAAIRAKGLGHHLKRSWDLNVNKIHMNTSGYWTALGVYQVLKWIFAHAEVDTNPAGPGVGLYITEIRRGDVKISIRPFTQPSAT
ncbi:hypothetical protein H1R20_g9001, partial [Candolleomyces eurysporus]